jgi:hypothetical protein
MVTSFFHIRKPTIPIDNLEKSMGIQTHRPEEIIVSLPGFNNTIDTIKVTRFDFMTQVQSLLDDSVLNHDKILVINSIDRFQEYFPPDGRLGECLSGSWYNHTWDKMEKDGTCDFMIPIILYIDKTQVSVSGKLTIYNTQSKCHLVFSQKRQVSSLISVSTPFCLLILTHFLLVCSHVDQQMHGVLWDILRMKLCIFLALNVKSILPMVLASVYTKC